jgi:hypothetical protein
MRVYVPHRIPAADRLSRLVNARMISAADVDELVLAHLQNETVDLEAVIVAALDGRDPPWTESISGKLQLAPDDGSEIVELVIVDGVADVPDEHVAHVLAGVHGAYLMED